MNVKANLVNLYCTKVTWLNYTIHKNNVRLLKCIKLYNMAEFCFTLKNFIQSENVVEFIYTKPQNMVEFNFKQLEELVYLDNTQPEYMVHLYSAKPENTVGLDYTQPEYMVDLDCTQPDVVDIHDMVIKSCIGMLVI